MKKRTLSKRALVIIMVACIALICAVALAACGSTTSSKSASKTVSTEVAAGQPPLQPKGAHDSRWETGGTKMCYGCHGAGTNANPMNGYAPAIPENHYIDGTSSTKQIEGGHLQCIQCHPVSTE